MATQPTDLALDQAQAEHLLSQWLGPPVRCLGLGRLHGGMLNSVFRLRFDRAPFRAVVKLSSEPGLSGFADEARCLNYLQEHTSLPSPKPYFLGEPEAHGPYSFLLHARLSPEQRAAIDRELAHALLELHAHTRDTFGAIDQDPGPAQWSGIAVGRLRDLRPEMDGKLPQDVLANLDRALETAEEALRPQGIPTLVHGDVWAGNLLVVEREDGWHFSGLVDPGLQFADVEQELAYLEVFETVGPAFFEVYTSHTPFRPGYAYRRRFYWLNTLMVHVWLFGDRAYCERTAALAAELVRES